MLKLQEIRKKLEQGKLLVGANVLFCDSDVSELFGFAGCDYVWIDMEHAALDYKDVERHIIGAHSGGAAAFVRIPWNDMVVTKRILDMGPDGIIIPMIQTEQDAADVVRFCSYPPSGVRGWNPIRAAKYGCTDGQWYLENADSLFWRIVMIEHINAVKDLEKILAVPGIDAVMIGPSDLTGSMGCLLKTDTAQFWEMAGHIVRTARAAGKIAGVALPADCPEALLQRWLSCGIQMVSVGQDANFLAHAVQNNVMAAQRAYERLQV